MTNRKAVDDGIVALMDQPAPGANGNGKSPAPERWVELHMRMNLDTGAFEARVVPEAAITNRHLIYGLLELMRDIAYRQQLPGELAILEAAAGRRQVVVAPDGAVPPFPGRG